MVTSKGGLLLRRWVWAYSRIACRRSRAFVPGPKSQRLHLMLKETVMGKRPGLGTT